MWRPNRQLRIINPLIDAVVYARTLDRTLLLKGMGKYDAGVIHGAEFPETTNKASHPGKANIPLYLDITMFTDRVMSPPMLNGSVASMLSLGIEMLPEGERAIAQEKFTTYKTEAKQGTFERLVRRSWALAPADEMPSHKDLRDPDVVREDPWPAMLVPQGNVDLLPMDKAKPGISADPTPLEYLLEEKVDHNPGCLLRRKKESLLRGRSQFWASYKRLEKKPKLFYKGFGCTVTCLVDTSGTLRPKQCYVMTNGKVVLGNPIAYRCPMALPSDMEEWEAVEPPDWLKLEDNCVIVSAEGHGVSKMAGGDYDGDLVMLVFCESFRQVFRLISPALLGFDFKALQLQLKAKLGTKCVIPFTETLPELRLREYLKYGNEFRNDQIRGRVTAVAERAVMQTLRGDFATVVPRRITGRGTLRQRSIVRSISFGFGTHFATDVPKHLGL